MSVESEAEKIGQDTLDRIVKRMIKKGYPVELTHKSGFKPDHIPACHYGGWHAAFEDNLAGSLVNG